MLIKQKMRENTTNKTINSHVTINLKNNFIIIMFCISCKYFMSNTQYVDWVFFTNTLT